MPKGVSAAEKRTRLHNVFLQSGAVFTLKEVEKAGSAAGIPGGAVKDVLKELTDDDLVATWRSLQSGRISQLTVGTVSAHAKRLLRASSGSGLALAATAPADVSTFSPTDLRPLLDSGVIPTVSALLVHTLIARDDNARADLL